MGTRNTARIVAVALLLVLAGCAGFGGGSGGSAGEATQTVAQSGGGDAESGDTGGQRASDAGADGATAAASIERRYRIRTAEAVVQVDSFSRARTALVERTRELDGYVGGSERVRHEDENRTWTTGTLTLRVPSENFSELVAAVRASGSVQRLETDTRDVTGEVVDLKARLQNLRAQRERLRALYQQANETAALLRIQRRLSEVQSRIEQLKGRLQALKHDVAYSTVTVELREERPEDRPEKEERAFYEVGLLAAFLDSVHGVVVLGRSLLVLTAYALPYVGALALPAAGAVYAVKRFRE